MIKQPHVHRSTITRDKQTTCVYVHTTLDARQISSVHLYGDYLNITDKLTQQELNRLTKKFCVPTIAA